MIDDEDPVETPDEEILAAACGMLRTGDRFLVCVAHIGDTQVYIEEEKGKPVPTVGRQITVSHAEFAQEEILAHMILGVLDTYPGVRNLIAALDCGRGGPPEQLAG